MKWNAKFIAEPLTSIFFGGGTPSLLKKEYLTPIFENINRYFKMAPQCEITLEANPETFDDSDCELWHRLGINRISMGAQSFSEKNLNLLERLALPNTIISAAERLKKNGFLNFNLDLIFAIPGQTLPQAIHDIEMAASLEPKHISFYNLTLKPGHVLYSQLPDENLAADLYEAGIEKLAELGFEQYEISNFSQPHFQSQHNLLYWSGNDFLGLGPSAASRFFWNGKFHHRKLLSDFNRYLSMTLTEVDSFTENTQEQTTLEALFLEIRKNEGIDTHHFQERYQHTISSSPKYSLLVKEGFLEEKGCQLLLTKKGRILADTIVQHLS